MIAGVCLQVYVWNKRHRDTSDGTTSTTSTTTSSSSPNDEECGPVVPAEGAVFPPHVEFLVVGAGTAAFSALRALRAQRPSDRVLLVGREPQLPYMRPPLSKELWQDGGQQLAHHHTGAALTFTQWNGRRRALHYEPEEFYTPVEQLQEGRGAAALARGWTVDSLDVGGRTARLTAPGRAAVTVSYDQCLIATGSRPLRVPALAAAAAAGRALVLHTVRDAVRLATALQRDNVQTMAVVGGGLLACELSAALAGAPGGRRVVLIAGGGVLEGVVPRYLQAEAARRLAALGVTVLEGQEVRGVTLREEGLELRLTSGEAVHAELAVEATGAAPDTALAAASGLELDAELGGLRVTAELLARPSVWAAGDAACWPDGALGRRRRLQHHDHAVLSGRRAADNMAAAAEGRQPQPYTHQPMFWSDLGPQLGFEAIGLIDSALPTVAVFSADAVTADQRALTADPAAPAAPVDPAPAPEANRYARGVVLYLRDSRVVGVLLWNLYNRMHLARQVLAVGQFDDLLEVGKLFTPHEED